LALTNWGRWGQRRREQEGGVCVRGFAACCLDGEGSSGLILGWKIKAAEQAESNVLRRPCRRGQGREREWDGYLREGVRVR
jgi:hypothetical protein